MFLYVRENAYIDLGIEESEPLALGLVSLPHGPHEVAPGPHHPQDLRDGRGVDLARGEPVAAHRPVDLDSFFIYVFSSKKPVYRR